MWLIAILFLALLISVMTKAELLAWLLCGIFLAGVFVGCIIGNGGSNAGRKQEELDKEQADEVKKNAG